MVHLFIFERLPDAGSLPDLSAPRFERAGEWSFALWAEGGRTYALGATGNAAAEESLRALFRA